MSIEAPSTLGRYAGSHWFISATAFILISVFSLWLLAALLKAEEAAEKMVVESTERNMRVGLKVAMGEALIAGRENEIAQWVGVNPLRWLDILPAGYIGNCVGALAPASWCFDTAQRQLLYRPRHDRHLQLLVSANDEKILRWQAARPISAEKNRGYWGVTVQLLTPYVWLKE